MHKCDARIRTKPPTRESGTTLYDMAYVFGSWKHLFIYALVVGCSHWGFGDLAGGLECQEPQPSHSTGQRFEPPAGRFWRPGRGCGPDGAKFIGRLS